MLGGDAVVQVHIAEQASLPGVGATHGTGVDVRKSCAIVASSGSDRQRVFHHPVRYATDVSAMLKKRFYSRRKKSWHNVGWLLCYLFASQRRWR
jgi:hypothetical protein